MACACCSRPTSFATFEAVALGEVAHRTPINESGADRYEQLVAERGAAAHETGHALFALSHGAQLIAVAISPSPMTVASYDKGTTVLPRLMGHAAGDVSEGIIQGFGSPGKEMLQEYIEEVRAGPSGSCDFCKGARLLVGRFPSASNEDLADAWSSVFRLTRTIMKTPTWEAARMTVSLALRDSGRLSGEEVAALVNVEALRAAELAVIADMDQNNFATWRSP